jgi:alpha-glucosidase
MDEGALLHAFRRFLRWRRSQPALIRGSLEPLTLPEPLVGFVRQFADQRVLAIFNLSEETAGIDLSGYEIEAMLTESGFVPDMVDNTLVLPGYGVFFASLGSAESVPQGALVPASADLPAS